MAGRAAAGPPTGFFAGRLTTFVPLTEAEIAAFATALGLSVADFGQRGLGDGRSAIRALELLVDGDVQLRIANASGPTEREVAAVLAGWSAKFSGVSGEIAGMAEAIVSAIGKPASAEAEAFRRMLPGGVLEAAAVLLRVATFAAAEAIAAEGRTGPVQWSSVAVDDAGFVSLAELLDDLEFPTEVAQDSEIEAAGGTYFDTAAVEAAAVLLRLQVAAAAGVAGAGLAADRLRKFMALKPVSIGRRLRQARERILVAELVGSPDADPV